MNYIILVQIVHSLRNIHCHSDNGRKLKGAFLLVQETVHTSFGHEFCKTITKPSESKHNQTLQRTEQRVHNNLLITAQTFQYLAYFQILQKRAQMFQLLNCA